MLLSGWTGVDVSRYPLDATIDYIDSDAGRSALASISSADPTRTWTVREAAECNALGGRGHRKASIRQGLRLCQR